MKTLKTVYSSDRGAALANKGGTVSNAIAITEWDADAFHRRVMDLELQGYVARRETYRVTPEMNPETGRIVHLHTVELYGAGSDEAEAAVLHHGTVIALPLASGAECRRNAVEVLP